MTPDEARRAVLGQRDFVATWIEMELIGGSRRAKRRHAEEQAREKLAAQVENQRLEGIAALPDVELAWLLEQGWDPARA